MDFLIMAAIAFGVDILNDSISILRELTHKNAINESTNKLNERVKELLSNKEALETFVRGAENTIGED